MKWVAALLCLLAFPANAQSCAPRETVIERLANKYGETLKSIGLTGSNSVMEVYASDETGTWTIIVTLPNGMACLITAGEGFEETKDLAL